MRRSEVGYLRIQFVPTKQKHMIGISKSLVTHIRRKSPDMDGVRVLHCTDTTHKQDAFGRGQTKNTKPPCSLENKRCCGIQLITINYPGSGNSTAFTYDGLGNRVKIVEVTGGSISGTKQFIFDRPDMSETRDAGGIAVVSQFFWQGECLSGACYYFSRDHLTSVREVCNSAGAVQASYGYSPYGQATAFLQNIVPDFQFAGYYVHTRVCVRTQ